MALECELDAAFSDYRERILISDGHAFCCESGVRIPKGFPYALCDGCYEGEWQEYPQALEVWRVLRNASRNEGHCLYFSGAMQQLCDEVYDSRDEGFWLMMRLQAAFKRVQSRYSEGKGPRLTTYEKASVDSDEWAAWVSWGDGLGRIYSKSDGTKIWDQPDMPYGKKWEAKS